MTGFLSRTYEHSFTWVNSNINDSCGSQKKKKCWRVCIHCNVHLVLLAQSPKENAYLLAYR